MAVSKDIRFHESIIDKYIDHGFIRDGFMLFIEAAMYGHAEEFYRRTASGETYPKRYLHICSLREDLFVYGSEECEEHLEMNNCEGCYHMASFLEWYGHCGKGGFNEHKKEFSIVPDAWRFLPNIDRGVLQIVEVVNTKEVTFKKLQKYAIIEDILFETAGIRVDLLEHQVYMGQKILHDLNWVFENSLDLGEADFLDVSDKKQMQFYSEMAWINADPHGHDMMKLVDA